MGRRISHNFLSVCSPPALSRCGTCKPALILTRPHCPNFIIQIDIGFCQAVQIPSPPIGSKKSGASPIHCGGSGTYIERVSNRRRSRNVRGLLKLLPERGLPSRPTERAAGALARTSLWWQ